MRFAWFLGALAVVVQMATNGRYGYFRDELYYLAASGHLAFGYVDFAPYYGMGWEHYPILICRDFKMPLAQAWPKLKTWN
jgi:hypothetical protein